LKYKAIFFDWDGTLVDSTGRIVDSMQRASQYVGMPALSDYAIRQIIGLGLPEALKTLWPTIGDEQLSLMSAEYSANFSHHSDVEVDFYAHAKELLAELRRLGYKLAVATGKTRKGLDEMLDGMQVRDLFHASRCADETSSKPSPHMLEELLHELNIKSSEALMVGDTSFDLEMALAIDMDSIGMSHGAHDDEILLKYKPRALCHSLQDLLNWIKANG